MDTNILCLLERTERRLPEKIAFMDDHTALTFAQLGELTRRIGSAVAEKAASRTPVALLMDARSICNLPAIYGIIAAGCAYAPLDITMPPERLSLLLNLMQPAAILTDEKGQRALSACEAQSVPVLSYAEAAAAEVQPDVLEAIRAGHQASDPMSILYTSGSTGVPKGSVQTHASYLAWTEATIGIYGLTEDTVLGNQSPFFYANSILEIFPPVALGATVYMLPAGALTFPRRLLDSLREKHVTCLCMTPSSFVSVAQAEVLTPGCLPEMRWGIMSGEPMQWNPLHTWMQATPNAFWWHFYGSTEMFSVAVGTVAHEPPPDGRLPVGKPFPHTHLLFLDENGAPVPAGEPGELYVSSPWVSARYHRDAERTAAAYIPDPLGNGDPKTYFRAGDIAFIRPDGQLMVLGRRDAQIKHMGYRMELGEVEAALRTIPGWAEGCVLYDRPRDRIFCFYTGALTEKQLRAALRERLARYMVPDVFVQLAALPHTASMKLDRAALTAMMAEK